MTVYEANQAMYEKAPPLNNPQLVIDETKVFIANHPGKYYMLLNNEKHYYTIFTYNGELDEQKLSESVFSIVNELGVIKDVLPNTYDALEFWIDRDMYLLFDYSRGVVTVE